jgi:hypothetical protein
MATLHPYEVDGYGGLDSEGVTTLNAIDLRGRLAGDVLTDLLYAAPSGEVHPALANVISGTGRGGGAARPIDEAKLRALHYGGGAAGGEQGGEHAGLGLDPKRVAKHYQQAYYARQAQAAGRSGGPASDAYGGARPEEEAVRPRGFYYGSARRVIPNVTPCECRALLARGLMSPGGAGDSPYMRDFHRNDDRYFNDGVRIMREFYDLPNASALAILLAREGVIAPPPMPLRVLAGREAPCACSALGPELVHRIYLFLREDWERAVISRYAPEDRSMGAVLARFNRRVVDHFAAEDALRSAGEAHVERARAMARGDAGAGTWDYEPLPAKKFGLGRVTFLSHEDAGVTENKRAHAEQLAARLGYRLDGGVLVDLEEEATEAARQQR